MYDLIIIGAGPAGLTAALYAGRSRLNTLVLEKMVVGGRILMSESIENFPGFPGGISTQDLIKRMEEQVRSLDIKIESGEVLELDSRQKSVKTNSKTYTAKAIIIAVGSRPRRLKVPGEERLIGKGVSYCATCDGPLYREKNVVLVGAGNAAAEEALYLSRFAKQLNLIHRRSDLRASAILQERLKENKKINFILNSLVTEIIGLRSVESIKIKDVNTAKERSISCDGVFVCIGYEPDTEFIRDRLKVDEAGFIITDENLMTSEVGIFACGDCRKKSLYQVITACGDGATVSDSAYKYLLSQDK
jgi:thioredoxin reductase (NADPH)